MSYGYLVVVVDVVVVVDDVAVFLPPLVVCFERDLMLEEAADVDFDDMVLFAFGVLVIVLFTGEVFGNTVASSVALCLCDVVVGAVIGEVLSLDSVSFGGVIDIIGVCVSIDGVFVCFVGGFVSVGVVEFIGSVDFGVLAVN